MVIADNGRGFAPGGSRGPGHQGLVNMQARVSGIGGQLTVDSAAGQGTRIIVALPYPDPEGLYR